MNRFLKMTIVVALIALPSVALATGITDFGGNVDCDGWCADVEVWFGSVNRNGVLHFDVALMDESGAVVFEDSGEEALVHDTNYIWKYYQFCGEFDELCGKFTAKIVVTLTGDGVGDPSDPLLTKRVLTGELDCDCPVDVCNFTPGFWKNHEKKWEDVVLSVGGVSLDQAAALDIMNTPVEGDATIILAYHLIAAKLNVLFGSDPGIEGAIMEADNLLAMYPVGSDPQGDARAMILGVKDQLADYNELGCGEDEGEDKALPNQSSSTWSDLKANFR